MLTKDLAKLCKILLFVYVSCLILNAALRRDLTENPCFSGFYEVLFKEQIDVEGYDVYGLRIFHGDGDHHSFRRLEILRVIHR